MENLKLNSQQLENLIGWYVRYVQFQRAFNRVCYEKVGMHLTQVRAMATLAITPDMTMGEIAERLNIRRSTTTAAIDALVESGYVERFNDSVDNRIIRGRLTPKSDEFFAVIPDVLRQQLAAIEERVMVSGSMQDLYAFVMPDGVKALLERRFKDLDFSSEYAAKLFDVRGYDDPLLAWEAFVEESTCTYNAIQFANKDLGLATNNGLMLAFILMKGGKVALRDIRSTLLLESGEATVCLDRLESKGLIRRSSDSKDRRMSHIRLTKKGTLMAESVTAATIDIFTSAFPGLVDAPVGDYLK